MDEYTAGLAITEVYRITGTPEDPTAISWVLKDNGTMREMRLLPFRPSKW
jgi:hypothetical protein